MTTIDDFYNSLIDRIPKGNPSPIIIIPQRGLSLIDCLVIVLIIFFIVSTITIITHEVRKVVITNDEENKV